MYINHNLFHFNTHSKVVSCMTLDIDLMYGALNYIYFH